MTRPWQGIIGRGLTAEEFNQYVSSLTLGTWKPQFCVVHNTGVPMFKEWHRVPGLIRMKGLENYYKVDKKWSAGPHLFVADDLIWLFTSLTTPGVHAPSWNSISWGIETVGDWNVEPLQPNVYANTIAVLTALHRKMGWNPTSIRFHREDPKTTHKVCPGAHLSKGNLITAVSAELGGNPSVVALPSPSPQILKLGSRGINVSRLQTLLRMQNLGTGAGVFGPRTLAAVVAFQRSQGLPDDGVVGEDTWRVLL